jgi:hypothetical protein
MGYDTSPPGRALQRRKLPQGAFKSYLVAHKSGLRGLLGDIVLAGTPAPEVHWLAKVKEVVEGLLFVHTVHELVP